MIGCLYALLAGSYPVVFKLRSVAAFFTYKIGVLADGCYYDTFILMFYLVNIFAMFLTFY